MKTLHEQNVSPVVQHLITLSVPLLQHLYQVCNSGLHTDFSFLQFQVCEHTIVLCCICLHHWNQCHLWSQGLALLLSSAALCWMLLAHTVVLVFWRQAGITKGFHCPEINRCRTSLGFECCSYQTSNQWSYVIAVRLKC